MPLYAHLRTALPRLGVAVFVYDRRDSGQSDRVPGGYDFDLLTQDGVAAADMLRRLPEIDGRTVGYWGLSQGGWLALLCASHDPRASFAVSVSAPITTPDVQMNFAVANILRVNGYSQADIDQALAARQAVDGYLRGQVTREAAQENLDRAKQAPWFKLAYLSESLGDPATSDWLKQMRLQPLTTLSGLKASTLMLYGTNDPWVPVAASVETLRAHAAEFPNVELHVIPQADHTMMVGVDPKLQMDIHFIPSAAPDSPAYFMTLAAWLTSKGLASATPR
jgi:pimeloyl-ACP methyl ester carboxylesterase